MIKYLSALPVSTKAAGLFMLGIFCFSIMDTFSKLASQEYHSLQVVWGRYFFQAVLTVLILGSHLKRLFKTRYLKLQILRSVFLFGGTAGFYTAIKFMTLAAATAVFEAAPLFITVLAYFILKEHVGIRRWIAVCIGMLGALIIIGPSWDAVSWIALLPLFAGLCFASYAIATRFLGSEENPLTAFVYTGMFGTLISSLIVPFVLDTPDLWGLSLMFAMGAFGGIGHYFMVRSLSTGEASFLAPFGYVSLVFNAGWGFLVFAEIPTLPVLIGALIIVGSGLFIWMIERRLKP